MWPNVRGTQTQGRVRWTYASLTAIAVAVAVSAIVLQVTTAPASVDYRSRMRDINAAAAFEAATPDPALLPTGREWVTHIEEDLLPYWTEMKDPVTDKLKRFGLFTRLGEQTFFATLEEAVSSYLATGSVNSPR